MSTDSITRCEINLTDRPLVVCDVDDVVLEFLDPFTRFLVAQGHELRPDSFRLDGNIYAADGAGPVDKPAVRAFIETFFGEQDRWQNGVEAAAETLGALSTEADIVFLTAMPPRHHGLRRQVLDAAGMPYPIIATEAAKGPEVAALHGGRDVPVAFIDDIYRNLHSVRDHVPGALLINLMAKHLLHGLAPHPGEGIETAADWLAAERLIRIHFGLKPRK